MNHHISREAFSVGYRFHTHLLATQPKQLALKPADPNLPTPRDSRKQLKKGLAQLFGGNKAQTCKILQQAVSIYM